MKLLKLLRVIVINIKQRGLKKCSIEKQKRYIYKFAEPVDDFERSYFQYKCQKIQSSLFFNLMSNIVAFVLLFIFYIKVNSKENTIDNKKNKAIFLANDIDKGIIPDVLHKEFSEISCGNNFDIFLLTKGDKKFIRALWRRYPFSFYFIYKCMMKIAMYSGQINENNPSAIIVYAEYSFTSSVLTSYCNYRNIEHINVMHGEKWFDITDSFFKFNRCYVWDEFYINLFIKLRACKEQFIVAIPPALKMELRDENEKIYDYTYYLMNENKAQLKVVKKSLDILISRNAKIAIRPHPRYTDAKLVSEIFKNFKVEDTKAVTIKESLEKTRTVIALGSTVLLQSYYNGKNVIIDDLVNKHFYQSLFDVEYIMLSKPHKLLSEVINEN